MGLANGQVVSALLGDDSDRDREIGMEIGVREGKRLAVGPATGQVDSALSRGWSQG